MEDITVTMVFDKETNNTIRYREVPTKGKPARIGNIYIPKTTLANLGNPNSISVTIHAEE